MVWKVPKLARKLLRSRNPNFKIGLQAILIDIILPNYSIYSHNGISWNQINCVSSIEFARFSLFGYLMVWRWEEECTHPHSLLCTVCVCSPLLFPLLAALIFLFPMWFYVCWEHLSYYIFFFAVLVRMGSVVLLRRCLKGGFG